MPPSLDHTCEHCPLANGGNHRVPKLQRVAHQAAVARLLERQRTAYKKPEPALAIARCSQPLSSGLDDDMSDEPSSPPIVEAQPEAVSDPADMEMERLASLFTGLVMLNDGPHPHRQTHSKLFSSRDEYQAGVPEIPTSFTPIPPNEALNGVEAILQSQSLPLRPAAIVTQQVNTTLLQDMLTRIRTARVELDIQKALDVGPHTVGGLTMAVKIASAIVAEAGRLLSSINSPGDLNPRNSKRQSCAQETNTNTLKKEVHDEAMALDSVVDVVGRLLPPDTTEIDYNTEHHFENPIAKFNVVAQLSILLALVCHVIVGISSDPVNLIMTFVNTIVQATMSLSSRDGRATATQTYVLNELPTSLESALRRFKIDPLTVVYAMCPTCHHTHAAKDDRLSGEALYAETCQGYIYPQRGARHICGTQILELWQRKMRPIKPFVFTLLIDYIGATLSDAELERMCEKACDDALAAVREATSANPNAPVAEDRVNNETGFEGPVPGKLFIQRDGRLRLAFQVMMDFLNPNGTRKRGNHDSIGILAVVNLNLTEDIRYRPENMWISIILGPNEPNHDQIDNYVRPLIDNFVIGWERGFHFSCTALHTTGRDVDLALVINVNDLPATRKAQGMSAANSHQYCSICDCYGTHTMYNTDFHSWTRRDISVLRAQAYAWQDAPTQAARDAIFSKYGVRWSEFWRLAYWDPTRMAVVDSMHCILEGLVHYHCRRVLRIDTKVAKRKETMGAAFEYNWPDYNAATCHPLCLLRNESRELPMIRTIQQRLVQPLLVEDDSDSDMEDDDGDVDMADAPDPRFVPAVTEEEMREQLLRVNLQPLRWVVHSLSLNMEPSRIASKKACCDQLLAWHHTQPLMNSGYVPRSINLANIHFIQCVIANTTTPAWVDSVPSNYGDSNAGTIKAAEWRLLSTIYLPIALVLLWGDQDPSDPQSTRLLQMLDHTMSLFSAVILVCQYTMTPSRADKYRAFLKQWVDGLHANHPHTRSHAMRPNVHMAFHIYDFLILFGPIISWWSFPFERVIGLLQRINTNNHIGGELESTLSRSFLCGAAIRRWLRRPDCPPVFQELKVLFEKTSPAYNSPSDSPPLTTDGERAHYRRNGTNFSRSRMHLGNSLVLYYPPKSRHTIAGSNEAIIAHGTDITFRIRRQEPLAHGIRDPFARYWPYFPARTYSSSMSNIVDKVPLDDVVAHYARFTFSDGRCVVLDLSTS
ncbi:unnamed protein product [Mycena citricolor]|uniref:Uncharacterized protein n=1 Tax=Mycena citricolor TaxID=2018698 RepID=A0AAD2H4J2_9AGAR|nr:unnamed protein product [Mycena citricolor]